MLQPHVRRLTVAVRDGLRLKSMRARHPATSDVRPTESLRSGVQSVSNLRAAQSRGSGWSTAGSCYCRHPDQNAEQNTAGGDTSSVVGVHAREISARHSDIREIFQELSETLGMSCLRKRPITNGSPACSG